MSIPFEKACMRLETQCETSPSWPGTEGLSSTRTAMFLVCLAMHRKPETKGQRNNAKIGDCGACPGVMLAKQKSHPGRAQARHAWLLSQSFVPTLVAQSRCVPASFDWVQQSRPHRFDLGLCGDDSWTHVAAVVLSLGADQRCDWTTSVPASLLHVDENRLGAGLRLVNTLWPNADPRVCR
jgi:hypothetical protein